MAATTNSLTSHGKLYGLSSSHSFVKLNSPKVFLSAVLCATSLWLGYQLGSRCLNVQPPFDATLNEDDGDEDEEEDADGDLAAVKAGFMEPCKLVLVVRTDLGMTPGKVAAQCGHATLACYKALIRKNPVLLQHWELTGQAKIALKAKSEQQLLELEAIAKSLNICARSIHDAGHTQVEAGTRTVLGIGPAPVELVNQY
ncbi:hypothetical protein AX15_005696 [Amanita polypyramis BW_CC]|nr:hypothetical protein AX15_005696 [Amanita polypyramis BW_CC]